MILWSYLSDLPFFVPFTSSLVWPKRILGELALVFVERSLGFRTPKLPLAIGKALPGETNNFGEGAVVGLNLGRNMIALDERGAKQDESIRRARNMILRLLLTMASPTRRGAIVGRREKDIFARRGIDKRWRPLIKSHRSDGRCEYENLRVNGRRLDRKSPDKLITCRSKSASPSSTVQRCLMLPSAPWRLEHFDLSAGILPRALRSVLGK